MSVFLENTKRREQVLLSIVADFTESIASLITAFSLDVTLLFNGTYSVQCCTINACDFNQTESKSGTLQISLNGEIQLDVLWGYGSVHSTYIDAKCSGKGRIDGSETLQTKKLQYTNGPYELWSGKIDVLREGIALLKGKYEWFGWDNRKSNGALVLTIFLIDSQQKYKNEGVRNPNKLIELNQHEVKQWLRSIHVGFDKYYSVFIENGYIQIEMIPDRNELREIGVTLRGHQIQIMDAIQNLVPNEKEGDQVVTLIGSPTID
eukprot:1092353_1